MKYVCDEKWGSHVFETAEECLRFEGACEARNNDTGAGCLLGLLALLALCAVCLL